MNLIMSFGNSTFVTVPVGNANAVVNTDSITYVTAAHWNPAQTVIHLAGTPKADSRLVIDLSLEEFLEILD